VSWRLVKDVQVATATVAPPWSTVLGHARPLSMSDRSATYTSTASVQARMNPNRPQDRTVQCLASDPRVERGDKTHLSLVAEYIDKSTMPVVIER